ncbi:uncharacterized protein LOC111863284, partial [Cryptotermes secundus]|uniref:uncharacterized protein LOC111863284 n=1 Tax=Cryptotermes secundus TaxID=105785 RepID=UPI001454D192
HIHSRLAPGAPFTLLGYSFGGLLALELALELEAEGQEGHLYLVDSAPDFMKARLEYSTGSNKEQFETNLICSMFNAIAPYETTAAAVNKVPYLAQEITLLKSWDDKLDHLLASLPMLKEKTEYYKAVGKAVFVRLKAVAGYEWNHNKRIKSPTILLRSTSEVLRAEEDYGLSK